jgi:hypothetical protein
VLYQPTQINLDFHISPSKLGSDISFYIIITSYAGQWRGTTPALLWVALNSHLRPYLIYTHLPHQMVCNLWDLRLIESVDYTAVYSIGGLQSSLTNTSIICAILFISIPPYSTFRPNHQITLSSSVTSTPSCTPHSLIRSVTLSPPFNHML